jgi:hypothetical protein
MQRGKCDELYQWYSKASVHRAQYERRKKESQLQRHLFLWWVPVKGLGTPKAVQRQN